MLISIKWITAFVSFAALICAANAQDYVGRKELEVIVSISETKPGETLPRHFHNGEEAFYVLDDTTVELPDGKQNSVKAGNAGNLAADILDNRRRAVPPFIHARPRALGGSLSLLGPYASSTAFRLV